MATNTTWTLETLLSKGPALHSFAVEQREQLERRLEAGFIEGMGADLQVLAGAPSQSRTSLGTQKAATQAVSQALAQAVTAVSQMRELVRTHTSDRAVQKLFGIGLSLNPTSQPSVKSGIEMVLKGCTEAATEARASGILPEDVEKLRQLQATISSTDAAQETKKADKKTVTTERNAAHQRFERSVKKLAAVSEVVFQDQPKLLARFRDAMPVSHRTTKKKPAEAEVPKADAPKPKE